MMPRVILILVLLLVAVSPAMATDYSAWQPLPGVAAGGTNNVGYMVAHSPSNITVGTLTLVGRNTTLGTVGVFATAASGSCTVHAYNLAAPKNYSYDVDFSYAVDQVATYDANFSLKYKIYNLQTFNLTRAWGNGAFELLGDSTCTSPAIHYREAPIIAPPGTDYLTYPDLTKKLWVGIDSTKVSMGWYNTFSTPHSAAVTFVVTDSINFANKLSGTTITLSNGQTGVTDSNGEALIVVFPTPSSTLTYSAVKFGWNGKFLQPLGGYGIDGGTVYVTLNISSSAPPSGYTRTTVHTTDGLTGAQIAGTTINLRDVENNTWVNSTSDADGQSIIDVITGHTLDIYGSYPGVYTSSSATGETSGGDYYLPMYPPVPDAPENFVNLFVYLREAGNLLAIEDVDVSFRYPSGTTIYSQTDASGTAMQIVPNQTVIIISATKTGWNGQSMSTTTGNFDDKFVTITLSRASAPTPVPTVTDPITGEVITAVPTVDARTDAQKDADLMAQLRDAGPSIIGLCILAIIFGLLKMIMKF